MINTLAAMLGVLAFCAAEPRPLLLLASICVSVVSWMMLRSPAPVVLPRFILNMMVLAATGQVVLRVLAHRNEVITDLTEYIGWVLIIKLLDRKSVRDEAQLLGLSAFAVIGAVLTSNSLPLGAVLLTYTPVSICSMVLLQLASGMERTQRLALGALPVGYDTRSTGSALALTLVPTAGRSVWRLCLLATALAVMLAVTAFVVTPRGLVRDMMGGWGNIGKGAQVDFNDRVQLGDAALLQTSGEPVMDVRLSNADGSPRAESASTTLYLRGAVLEQYDPRFGTWVKRGGRAETLPTAAELGLSSGEIRDRPPGPDPSEARRLLDPTETYEQIDVSPGTSVALPTPQQAGQTQIRQEVSLRRPLEGNNPLMSLLRPLQIQTDRQSQISIGKTTALVQHVGSGSLVNYSILSSPDAPEPPEERPPAFRQRRRFLDPLRTSPAAVAQSDTVVVPEQRFVAPFLNSRVRSTALELMAKDQIPAETSARQPGDNRRAIAAFIKHLQSTCSYSLELTAAEPDVDPIESFMFNSKSGHCEYFASALAAMCLSVNIPARVVTGYAGGEFNSVSGTYTIRKSDAHAWVEARPSPTRWETFDPTPASDLPHTRRASGGLWAYIKHLYEALEFSWVDNIVTFDQSRSRSGPAISVSDASKVRDDFLNWLTSLGRSLPQEGIGRLMSIGMMVCVAAIVCWGSWMLIKRLGSFVRAHIYRTGSTAGSLGPLITPDTRFYAEMLSQLNRAGLAKPASLPPLDYARQLRSREEPLAEIVDELSRLYYRLRFAGEAPTESASVAADDALDRLKAVLAARATVR